MSKKEQLRRIKAEAAKQDEERASRRAIEEWKLERAEKLKKLSEEERAQWIKEHAGELEAEKKKELKSDMLDEAGQEELRKIAADARAKKRAEAMEAAFPKLGADASAK